MISHDDSREHSVAEETRLDPVCGMEVAPADAAGSFEYRGHTYLFCNPGMPRKIQSQRRTVSCAQNPGTSESRHVDGRARLCSAVKVSFEVVG